MTVFEEDFFRQQIKKSHYVENITAELQETLSSYGMASGFDAEFFEQAVSRDMLEADIYREISRLYTSAGKKVDAKRFNEHLKEELLANIRSRSAAQEEDIVLSQEQQSALDYLADAATTAYVSIVSIPFTDQIFNVLRRLQKMNTWGLAGLTLLDALCVLILLLSGKNSVSRRGKVENLMNAIAGSAFVLIAPAIWLAWSGFLKRIYLSSKAYYSLLQQYFNSVMQMIWILIGIMAALWFLGLLYRQVYIHKKSVQAY
ncbi:MAG: hypothetical protein LBT44_02050 [Clostridiales bacterium]|nr:hypothetical protein [Clostridiales bacterium]